MNNFFADETRVRVLGRSLFLDGTRYLSWCCSGVEFNFTGKKISAEIWTDFVIDEPWKENWHPYIAVFLNGEEVPKKRIKINSGTNNYTIFESEKEQTVTLKILKLSESAFGKIGIVKFSADGEITPTKPRKNRFEFIGDSITCGFGIEGKSAEEGFRTDTENSYISYGAEVAKAFDADFNLISWSSIGVYSSDCKEDNGKPNDGWIMPMLYDYTDLAAEDILKIPDRTEWDFNNFIPDIIVVNLGTNDMSFTKKIPERVHNFKEAYKKFILHIREKNPSAEIICVLGMMGDELYPAVAEAAEEIADKKVRALRLDVQLEADGTGSEKHPNFVTHKKAAEKIIKLIKEENLL
ncbi:MAG: GDSL-type esterase/lipase family protein [Ruminococcus sp.]|nr:GDSL-type esterase/lipase family protein [Ruminococcus sp.]MCM1479378.1 GDSL-type esterase/lipase family protein [Muribaculaceae bacterium]